jgi:probable HAF family extracellular repeat protein
MERKSIGKVGKFGTVTRGRGWPGWIAFRLALRGKNMRCKKRTTMEVSETKSCGNRRGRKITRARLHVLVFTIFAAAWAVMTPGLCAQRINRQYRVVVLPPDGGEDSFLAGYLFYAPLTHRGTLGVSADTGTPGVYNSYTWRNGRQVDFQPLPQLPNLTGTNTFINWINQRGLAAGYGTRTDSITGASVDNAAIWRPNGQVFELSTPEGDQSRAVWINDFGQVSGWIENSTVDPCAFGVGLQFQSQAVIWRFGVMRRLGTLGGTNSYGEFINNLGQVSGHSDTSTTPNAVTGCPPFDPFIWQNGKMIDINPGNFGGAEGGTNFLNNRGQAVGFGTLPGEVEAHPFLWSRGKLTDLNYVGNLGRGGSAFSVNELGHVVGVSRNTNGAILAVLWRNGEFTDLSTLSGDDCSEPYSINSHDQIVGASFSCETGLGHAFLWENGQMVDLNTLIPSNSGIELQSADWINEDGEIAAQAILTPSGAQRAVLLIPNGECDSDAKASSAGLKDAARPSQSTRTPGRAPQKGALRINDAGPLNPMLLRPFSPTMLWNKAQN